MKIRFLTLLLWAFLLPGSLYAGGFGVSVALGHDVIKGRSPVTDLNLFFGDTYGLRFTHMPSSVFYSHVAYDTKQAVLRKISGASTSVGLMKFWEKKQYQPSQGLPLSFLGAYTTLGYARPTLQLRTTRLTAEANQLKRSETVKAIIPTTWLVEAGFYGGDRFALIDLRLQYRISRFKPDWQVRELQTHDWALILSGGISF